MGIHTQTENKTAIMPPEGTTTAKAASEKRVSAVSIQAIKSHIAKTYPSIPETSMKSQLKLALKRGVESGALVQAKGTGASGSFKIGKVEKPKVVKKVVKKAAPAKKPAAKKPVKKAATKSPKKAVKKTTKAKSPKKVVKKATTPPKPAAKSKVSKVSGAKKSTVKKAVKKVVKK